MQLALFDLDLTLLPIDTADTWSRHVVRRGGLERVTEPVVTNGDARLAAIARERGWPTLQLFERAAE